MNPRKQAAQEAARLERKYGLKSGSTGGEAFQTDVIPTGSLALDYALGTGGWPRRHVVEVFGAPDIGKSSVIGLNAIRNAQGMNLLCGIVALEPGFDKDWATKNGVDPEAVVIGRPDNGEDAFAMLYEWVMDDIVDFILFDSIGAVLSASEVSEEGKPRQGGQSGLITWGIKRILVPTFKNNKGVILLNQQRDDMKARIPGQVESPGGHALKHCAAIRIHLKTTGSPFKARVPGEDDPVVIGKTLVGVIKRNKLTEGTGKRAEFDFYQMETEEHPVGIDSTKDIIATGMRTRVIEKAGAWYRHPSFPGEKQQLQGRDAVEEYLADHPRAVARIRKEVLAVMLKNLEAAKHTKPELEVVDGTN